MVAAVSLQPFADITPRASCVASPLQVTLTLSTQARKPVLTLSQPTELYTQTARQDVREACSRIGEDPFLSHPVQSDKTAALLEEKTTAHNELER